jgi:hypothetical protein
VIFLVHSKIYSQIITPELKKGKAYNTSLK